MSSIDALIGAYTHPVVEKTSITVHSSEGVGVLSCVLYGMAVSREVL